MHADAVIVPRNESEVVIDIRRRYARCVRMVWTMLGIMLVLSVALGLVAFHHLAAMQQIAKLTDQLEYQEQVRRKDRAEQRYAICQREGESAPPVDLCDGYESLAAAYVSEGVVAP